MRSSLHNDPGWSLCDTWLAGLPGWAGWLDVVLYLMASWLGGWLASLAGILFICLILFLLLKFLCCFDDLGVSFYVRFKVHSLILDVSMYCV